MERYSDFKEVYAKYNHMVFDFCLVRTKNFEVSQEITNDVFVKILL